MNRPLVFIAIAALVTIAAVESGCPKPPVQPAPDADASQVILGDAKMPSDASCPVSCAWLRVHGCAEGFGVDGGLPCEDVCARTSTVYTWNPACTVPGK